MPMFQIKSLYSIHKPNVPVYVGNTLIGRTTSYTSIAHDGRSIGSIELDTGNWISGYGVYIEGIGIKVWRPDAS